MLVAGKVEEMPELVKREMESATEFRVPILAEVGLGKNCRYQVGIAGKLESINPITSDSIFGSASRATG